MDSQRDRGRQRDGGRQGDGGRPSKAGAAGVMRPIVVGIWAATAVMAGGPAAMPAQAQALADPAAARPLNFPARPLGEALADLGAQTGFEVVYPTDLVAGRVSAAVQGVMTPAEALERMLAGTGLEAVAVAGGGTTLRPVSGGTPAAVTLEALTVTAQKREQTPDEVPFAMTVLPRVELEEAGVEAVGDLSRVVPGVEIADNVQSRRYSTFTIRGLGDRTFNPDSASVGVYVDEVFRPVTAAEMDLLDVEQVEVLKGPQGTLYGRNSIGGAINVTTRAPSMTGTEAEMELGVGDYAAKEARLYLGAPLVRDRLAGSVTVAMRDRDGYVDNIAPGKGELDPLRSEAVRLKLVATPNDRLRLEPVIAYTNETGGSPLPLLSTGLPGRREIYDEGDFRSVRERTDLSLRASWQASDDLELTSITAFARTRDVLETSNATAGFGRLPGSYGDEAERTTEVSQEIRLATPDDGRPVYWTLGGTWYRTSYDNRYDYYDVFDTYTSQTITAADYDIEGYAAFADVAWRATERLTFTLGGRYTHEEKELTLDDYGSYFGLEGRAMEHQQGSFVAFSPAVSARYAVTSDITAYARIAHGFKPGGFVVYGLGDPIAGTKNTGFASESAVTYEIGMKSHLLDQRLDLDVALYHSDVSDQQYQTYDGATLQFLYDNADVRIWGAEVQARAWITDRFDVSASLGLIDAEYTAEEVSGIRARGKKVQQVPDYDLNLAARYVQPLEDGMDLVGRAEWALTGRSYFDVGNTISQAPYSVVNLRLGLETPRWDLSAWVRNVFDEDYAQWGYVEASPRAAWYMGPPRTFGVRGRLKF